MIHENVQGFDMEMARQAFQRDYAIYEIPVQTSDVGFGKIARRPRKYAIMCRLDAVRVQQQRVFRLRSSRWTPVFFMPSFTLCRNCST